MIRNLIFHILYWLKKLTNRNLRLNGFCVIFQFPKSRISLGRGTINSSFTSNMLGLWQPAIIIARYGGVIEIGDGFGISGSTIYSTSSIKIGKNVLIGANCKIVDNDFHPLDAVHRRLGQNEQYTVRKPIVIGDDCFIGMNSIILKGTILGNNVIVGAGSIVSGHFPDNCIIAGNPAKIIKQIPRRD
ncbi:MAG: acyltransferase [Muribaculaceae bacterium]|nr:acyltransferase [Muribaculaceae bacterium]